MKAFKCDRCHAFRTDAPIRIWFSALTRSEVVGKAMLGKPDEMGDTREYCKECHEAIQQFAETSP